MICHRKTNWHKILEEAVVNNIDAIIDKSSIILTCQNGSKRVNKIYSFVFGGGPSSGKSFTFMHFLGQTMHTAIPKKTIKTETISEAVSLEKNG